MAEDAFWILLMAFACVAAANYSAWRSYLRTNNFEHLMVTVLGTTLGAGMAFFSGEKYGMVNLMDMMSRALPDGTYEYVMRQLADRFYRP